MGCFFFFFFNDTATTEIYTLSLHDALPIYLKSESAADVRAAVRNTVRLCRENSRPGYYGAAVDRKSTRLNSSHGYISYAVFCLKKKKNTMSSKRNVHARYAATEVVCTMKVR